MTRLLDRAAVRSVLRWPDVIDAVRASFLAANDDRALPPGGTQVALPAGSMHIKAGGLIDPTLVTVKANLRMDGARAFGVVLVYDADEGTLRAIVDSADITAYRTAAVAALAARALGGRDGASVALVGAGPVGAAIVAALPHQVAVGQWHLWSRQADRAGTAVAAAGGTPVRVHATPGEAAAGADLVITCTPSREPLLHAADLRPDAIVVAMGSDSPGKRELAGDVLAGAAVVVDDPVGARRVGETTYLGEAGADAILGDLGSVLAGRVEVPSPANRRLVFDSVGIAYVDTAVAALVVRAAEAAGLGENFAF